MLYKVGGIMYDLCQHADLLALRPLNIRINKRKGRMFSPDWICNYTLLNVHLFTFGALEIIKKAL